MATSSASTSSVSKGCFVIRPRQSSNSRKRKLESKYDASFPQVRGEPDQHCHLRYELYNNTWSEVENQVSLLQAALNDKVFGNLLEYIKRSSSHEKVSKVKNEIPTAVFITGVNMPDHDVIFSGLVKELSSVTVYVARLCSKNCPNIKTILKEATNQIMENAAADVDEDSDEDSESKPVKFTSHRMSNMTMSLFSKWYEMQEASQGRTKDVEKHPVVIIFEDFESFQPKALQDFITICSLYGEQLPVVLLFGIATIPAVLHQLLPRSVSSCLCIEKFHSQPAITYLLEVIDRILITAEFAFKLGPRVFQYLYENFLFHDFSLQNFIVGLKFCAMDHFYSNPLSVLCSKVTGKAVEEFSHEQLEIVRKCPSFQKYAEQQQDANHLRSLVLDDDYTRTFVSEQLDALRSYHRHFFPVLRCLSALVTKLPGYPLGKKCRDVYECCLKANMKDVDSYHQAMKMATFLAKDELVPVLEECVDLLTSAVQRNGTLCDDFEDFLDAIKMTLLRFEELSSCSVVTQSVKPSAVPEVRNRFELQEKLKNAVYQKKKDSPFEQNREAAVGVLDKMFQRYLLCPSDQALHEVFYYDAIEIVKQRLSGCPRVAIQTALNNPRYYLNCQCCEIEPGAIQDTLPDISVAFKLHLECGRLINLFDWLQAFLTVTEPATVSTSGKTKLKASQEQELHARFIQAVSELQFLGFIKATKRKTDHVARLTWGSC